MRVNVGGDEGIVCLAEVFMWESKWRGRLCVGLFLEDCFVGGKGFSYSQLVIG